MNYADVFEARRRALLLAVFAATLFLAGVVVGIVACRGWS